MSLAVVAGASIVCPMGAGPGVLNVTSQTTVQFGGKPAATVMDTAPMSNVGACGMCTSMANPAVASATAAALGVLTPQPCTPTPTGTWQPAGMVKLGGKPVLTQSATLTCAYGGTITITNPGQTKVMAK
ncbi:MAG: DUF4280 domain-containing protein [Eubacteriales bacterium]